MIAFSSKPAADADNGSVFPAIDLIQGAIAVGSFSGFTTHGFVRFPAPGLIQGVTIDDAILTLKSHEGKATTGTFKIVACDEDASAEIATEDDFAAKPQTTATTIITPGITTTDTIYMFDVKSVLQEIVDRPEYSGGAIQLLLVQVDLSIDISFHNRSEGAANEPVLSGNYSTGVASVAGTAGSSFPMTFNWNW